MCGIVGVARFGELGDKSLRASALYLATTLLEVTETRGKDATGVSALFDDGNFFGQKMGVSSSEFVARFGGKADDFDGLLTVLREYEAPLRLFMGHCRKKSAGSLNNVDNHPIKIGNIIGVHNGTLKNHDIIFDNLKCGRDGEVDSEAIFRLFKHFTKECKEPFTIDMIEEVCKRLEGSFSILAFNANNPNQLVSARDGRPAEYCLIKPLRLVLVASEKKFFDSAIWSYNKAAYLHNFGGFAKLKESDVEFATLPDDTAALFDLTKEITPKTVISDLYETKTIPKAAQRIWKTPIKTTNYGTGYTAGSTYNHANQNRNFSGGTTTTYKTPAEKATEKAEAEKEDKKSEQTVSTKTNNSTDAVEKGASLGKVWSNKFDSFVEAFGNKNVTKQSVILTPEKKHKLHLKDAVVENELDNVTADDGSVDLEDDNLTVILDNEADNLTESVYSAESFKTGDYSPINEITPIEPEKKEESSGVADVLKMEERKDLLDEMKAGAAKGVANSKDEIDATKAAKEALKDVLKFENVYDVVEFTGIELDHLQKLPLAAFANRIITAAFNKLFIRGYLAKCTSPTTKYKSLSQIVRNPEERLAKAQKHIRVLKSLNSCLDSIVTLDIDSNRMKTFFTEWSEAMGKATEVDETVLKSIFNAGDFRVNKTLKTMTRILEQK